LAAVSPSPPVTNVTSAGRGLAKVAAKAGHLADFRVNPTANPIKTGELMTAQRTASFADFSVSQRIASDMSA
jgi:hypothetical protein